MTCELCTEFAPRGNGREGRILAETDTFVVVPTRGPLHIHHLLLCTRRHATGLHNLTSGEIAECVSVLERLDGLYGDLGAANLLLFENGTARGSDGGCSVTHFHMHLVPLNSPLDLGEVGAVEHWHEAESLAAAAQIAKDLGNYLLVQRPGEVFRLASRVQFASQHMRRVVARKNGVELWDWRVTDSLDRGFVSPPGLTALFQDIAFE
jgi:diadenosine tetraphosphate (Ap4A) HIT family hydrolase